MDPIRHLNGRLFRLAPIALLFGLQAGCMVWYDALTSFWLAGLLAFLSPLPPLFLRAVTGRAIAVRSAQIHCAAAVSAFVSSFSAAFLYGLYGYFASGGGHLSALVVAFVVLTSGAFLALMLAIDAVTGRIAFGLSKGEAVIGAVFHAVVLAGCEFVFGPPTVLQLLAVAGAFALLCVAAILRHVHGTPPAT